MQCMAIKFYILHDMIDSMLKKEKISDLQSLSEIFEDYLKNNTTDSLALRNESIEILKKHFNLMTDSISGTLQNLMINGFNAIIYLKKSIDQDPKEGIRTTKEDKKVYNPNFIDQFNDIIDNIEDFTNQLTRSTTIITPKYWEKYGKEKSRQKGRKTF